MSRDIIRSVRALQNGLQRRLDDLERREILRHSPSFESQIFGWASDNFHRRGEDLPERFQDVQEILEALEECRLMALIRPHEKQLDRTGSRPAAIEEPPYFSSDEGCEVLVKVWDEPVLLELQSRPMSLLRQVQSCVDKVLYSYWGLSESNTVRVEVRGIGLSKSGVATLYTQSPQMADSVRSCSKVWLPVFGERAQVLIP